MVGTIRLDAAALGALENDLTLTETHPLDVLGRCVSPRNSALQTKSIKIAKNSKN
jgi:hypothetical protein